LSAARICKNFSPKRAGTYRFRDARPISGVSS
jgi:hypothetical protein